MFTQLSVQTFIQIYQNHNGLTLLSEITVSLRRMCVKAPVLLFFFLAVHDKKIYNYPTALHGVLFFLSRGFDHFVYNKIFQIRFLILSQKRDFNVDVVFLVVSSNMYVITFKTCHLFFLKTKAFCSLCL